MAPASTPRRSAARRPGRPPSQKRSNAVTGSERPEKRLRYIPGGPGGGGRYVDEDGNETPVGGTGPGGPAYAGARRRSSHRLPTTSPPVVRDRPRRAPIPRSRYESTAAAAASAMSSEGYKPREERSWEEFHPDLDIDAALPVFSAEEVDGSSRSSNPVTPSRGFALSLAETGAVSAVDSALRAQQTPGINGLSELENPFSFATAAATPLKRRPGRPPKNQMLSGLGSPPAPRITPLPTYNPKERLSLPKPNYRRIDTFRKFEEAKNVGVNFVDKSMANVGYQETDRFARAAETYIRASDSLFEDELDVAQALREDGDDSAVIGRVEYDMDEQDERWLEGINAERQAEQVDAIKPAIFEITMTQIEMEWHALEKRIPKTAPKAAQTHRPRSGSAAAVNGEAGGPGEEQDTKCAICDDGDCENTNAIVFCDGCDLAVHQECYGVPFIPEGQWHCRKCQLLGRNNVTCIFCPNTEGAFKQTNTLKWAHLLCAIWVPEVSLGNMTFMEPIMDVEKVPKQRWRLTCYICQQKMGACIQCSNKSCYQAFHPTCARRGGLCLKMKNGNTPIDPVHLKGYCHKHVSSEWRRERHTDTAIIEAVEHYRKTMKGRKWADSQTSALSLSVPTNTGYLDDEAEQEENAATAATNKRKRLALQKKIWRLPSGAPIVPLAVYDKVDAALQRFAIRKRKDFVAEACKYWSLKREARRGASLLKRLQLHMETFTSMELTRRNFVAMGAIGRPRLLERISFAEGREKELERIQLLTSIIKQREDLKNKDVQLLRTIVDSCYAPLVPLMLPAIDKAISLDDNNHFYFTASLEGLRSKVNERVYHSVIPLAHDLANLLRDKVGVLQTGDMKVKLSQEQKHIKHRANIIIAKVKPMLMEAARKEAELGLKGDPGAEEDAQRVFLIFQNAFKNQPGSALPSIAGAEEPDVEVASRPGSTHGILDGHSEQDAEGDIDMPDASRRVSDRANEMDGPKSHEEMVQINDVKLQLDTGDTQQGIGPDDVEGIVPALSNSGSTNPSHGHADPPTPPRSEKDLLDPLANGGIPWYLELFNPHGTTIYDEEWPGRDVLRDLSEELSELDEDALNDLVDSGLRQENAGVKGSEASQPTSAQTTVKKKVTSRKRRLR
ncbi:uncharacterized protein PV09_06336 [Verruconis gallopava]|uniref:PHD-type domain-containing protein n=1 Tax=Verruconis gallopava TaxID=253628 RepID=A0A0D1YN40_9PEZI|nr:uncharacterized protein PV09_06336 [Verruconis gallopava]KIW02172.1 hypothetical protein PV09_06336 [Verruconis gallopava]